MCLKMSTEWSSNGALVIDPNYEDVISSSLDDYSDFSYNHKNIGIDWHFPVIDLCEDTQWLLFENNYSKNEFCISDICYRFKKELQCEFQTEIFLQQPLIIEKLIKWLNENKETELILECLNYFVEKLIKRYYEYTTGLFENIECLNPNSDSNSRITLTDTNNCETTTNDEISRWGIAKFWVTLMPTILKHISYNTSGAFSLFISSIRLLSSIIDSCKIKFYIELVFSNHTIEQVLLTEPLSSLKFLIIAKELSMYYLPNAQFKEIICTILNQPYWIHLYPELYHQLNKIMFNEEPLELKIIKMVENAHTISSTCKLDVEQYAQLLKSSLPIIWFHKKFNLIDKFITDVCKYVKLTENHNEYGNILLNLLSFKSTDVVIHTYLSLNKTVKKLLNNFYSESKKIDRLIEILLCTNVLNEIICFGCVNSNKQVRQLASEIMEQLLKSKSILKNDQWKCFLNNLVPIFPVLYSFANQTSTLGKTIFNLFEPDQSEMFNISKLVLLHSMILMLLSKDKESRVEAKNRITWLLKTTLNKSIDLPNDIFVIEFDDVIEKIEDPIGEYCEKDLDDMICLISNKCSSHQTVKCALYKISVMLEYGHLQQYFIHSGGINIILNLLKSSELFVNERGLLIALLKLLLCFTKKKKCIVDKHNLITSNLELQLQLISSTFINFKLYRHSSSETFCHNGSKIILSFAVLSDFYDVVLVKQYISKILFFCIFDKYLIHFGEIPKVVMDKIYTPVKINKYQHFSNNLYDTVLFENIKENKNCMDVLIITWYSKHFDNIDLFLKNGLTTNAHGHLFNDVFQNFRKASINWSVENYLIGLIAAKSHPVALAILGDLKRYLELILYTKEFDVDEKLFENALKKFLILPPICITDLQTLITVLRLLSFVLKKKALINKLNWVADILINSESMHHDMVDNFKNDEESRQLCNQYFAELYEVYWLCLKNYTHFSTLNLTKLLFNQLRSINNNFVLLQVNLKCLTLLIENPKNINKDLAQMYLSQLISLKTILKNEKILQRSYLIILNHILHHTILIPNICNIWSMYDWETWTWSMIHNTDPLVCALVFQFSAGLAVIDIPLSHNLIHLALNYFCESNCLENCIVAEQATIFCSNVFCNPKFKSLCLQYIFELDFNALVQIINVCSNCDTIKSEKKISLTSPKLVANICCMLFNMITITELDLHEFNQNTQLVHALITCLKKNLTPTCIKKPNIMEMCGRICSILSLFIPVCNYNFENLLTSLNIIYERTIDLDPCTTMVWRSIFKLTTMIIQFTNYKTFNITINLISALMTSITSKNNDLCIDALNVICVVYSLLSKKFAHHICQILSVTLLSEWQNKLKRKMLLITLSNVILGHPFTYETVRRENVLCFIISRLKVMQIQITKQSTQKTKTLQADYLEIVGFCCNIFHGCINAREDASAELPDLIHKLWPIVVSNPKSDMINYTIKMLTSFTSNCQTACSSMTMTSSTLGVDPKTKSTSFSLLHEVILLFNDFHLHGDILKNVLILISNCCQAQECRVAITKSKLLSNIISALNLKDKKRSIKIEQQCLNFLLIFTSYNEGQICLLKVTYSLDTLVDLLKSNYKNDSIAILRNLCFNTQNRIIMLSSDVFLNGIKTMLEKGNLTDQQYRDIYLSVWSIACNNQKARLQLRHWGIDKYLEKSSNSLTCDDKTQDIINCTYQSLKN